MKLRERFRRLTLWNKIGVMGAVASIVGIPLSFILFRPQDETDPLAIVITEYAAFEKLHEGNFREAAALFDKILAIDPTNSRLWEGNAYANLGKSYPESFDLNRVWDNFNLEPKSLTGVSYSCAQKALGNARDGEEFVHANLVMGLVLELAGYDDYGATRHGLSPLHYYAEAYKLVLSLDFRPKLPRSVAAIRYTPYPEVVDFAVKNRLRKYHDTASCESLVDFHFADYSEMSGRLYEVCDDL